MKDFREWSKLCKLIDQKEINFYFKEREVWCCSIGVNLGKEVLGKGYSFSRPVLIIKKVNKHLFVGVPLTSTNRKDKLILDINKFAGVKFSKVSLAQIKVFSSKRLIRNIGLIKNSYFDLIRLKIVHYLSD